MTDRQTCAVCVAADEATGYDTYAMYCNEEHTEDAIALARALGAAIWGDDPVPPENLATHLEDAAEIIADGMEGHDGWDVVTLVGPLAGVDGPLFMVNEERIYGIDPNEEGMAPPRRLDDLIVRSGMWEACLPEGTDGDDREADRD